MAIHVALNHRTEYRYDRSVLIGPQIVRLRPAPHCRTRILSYSLRVQPTKHFINWQQDPQANFLARLVIPDKTDVFSVEVDLVAEMAVYNPFDFFLEPAAERFPFAYDSSLDHELEPFRRKCEISPRFEDYLRHLSRELLEGATLAGGKVNGNLRTIDFLVNINRRIRQDISYIIRLEPGVQTPEETLAQGKGSCRDSAWLLCQILRHLGLSARFVSGYLVQLTADVKSLDGPSGPGKDFTDLHAWCEVYLPGAGWIGLDPTSGLLAGEGHIPLAATPDPQSAAPVSGLVDECKSDFSFQMSIARIYESPRVTKPYTEEQWTEINSLGNQIDSVFRENDCRLTMGGEPTFISIDDMESAEWNTTALGPTKRRLADNLIRRLKASFAPGALLHYGQGKWYPGESLPRWAFGCYWRKDGQSIWGKEGLFAEEGRACGFDEHRAEKFIYALAARLGIDNRWIMPGFEDAWYYLWRERRLPTNVDPLSANLKSEEERGRLARIFEQGLENVAGFALPLERRSGVDAPYWFSGPWFFRSERCYLLPGDSPMGFRLPLDSLPHVDARDYPYVYEQDPWEKRAPLPPRFERNLEEYFPAEWLQAVRRPEGLRGSLEALAQRRQDQRLGLRPEAPDLLQPPPLGQSAPWVVRTALCVEPRSGTLHVFMPPVRTLEDYLDLVSAVEDTADLLDTPVMLEGYAPPYDSRLNVIKVTPDPGVIEVNIHPAQSWEEMVEHTEILYEVAHQSRLGTEKFMLDGRHAGTGGGNHIILGGPTPAQTPLLQRPDLLRSLLVYWQNHPSLSFLFSGLFLGPTSQSPRIDEARNDSLYELEIALDQIPEVRGSPPWLVDRLLRNLLVDATGNTHRAEFCIDKLFNPESAAGRLGLLEMRAFEMPPHARMSLAQQLLLRALIAKFWREPYKNKLVRWGTDIHDRWMLPHFVWSDFADVIENLNRAGFPVKLEWFAPHFEFRFPLFGVVEVNNIWIEIRQALEPWHVLGEEGTAGGTARYVDSSVERLQVKATGLTDTRYLITVKGRSVPLHPTGSNGEYVAGVRYRAWQPPSCLHPTIGVHAPLVFDIFDTWNKRSLGGCTYHVAHPGGRNYSTFPVNAYEAESRRLSRFERHGHTPGQTQEAPVPSSREFPFTLDLRAS